MKLKNYCQICNKPLLLTNTHKMSNSEVLEFFKCGHFFLKEPKETLWKFVKSGGSPFYTASLDGEQNAYQFQIEGVNFANETNGNCLIADQQTLGKTIQALLIVRNSHPNLKILFVVKSSVTYQWLAKYKEWCDDSLLGIYMIQGGSKAFIPPGFKSYIISMDTFSRMVKCKTDAAGRVMEIEVTPQLRNLGIQFVIVDECQCFKDPSSLRAKALIGFIQDREIKHKVFLSGTPIKNRADEYFVTLNLLDPERFQSLQQFRRQYLVSDFKGRFSRVNPYMEEQFRSEIAEYVIRREVKDVMKDLPEFRRNFEIILIDDEHMREVYNNELQKLKDKADASVTNLSYMEISEHLMTLRRITGLMKVDFTVDYVDTFLDSIENEKIAIGVHHHAVRDTLYAKLEARGIKCLKLSGEDSGEDKFRTVKEFAKEENRVLIVSILAGGVGIDGLQVCNNVIVLERQWNSVDEEQFEFRFRRKGQTRNGTFEYFMAKGTIDETVFKPMVEEKRHIFGKTVGNDWDLMGQWDMRDLVESLGKI